MGESQNQWDVFLPQLAGTLRSTVNMSTGFTPIKIMLGREVNTHTYLMFPFKAGKGKVESFIPAGRVLVLLQRQRHRTCIELRPIMQYLPSTMTRWNHAVIDLPARMSIVSAKKEEAETDKIYCICRQPWDGQFMIQCDYYNEWYHGACINIPQSESIHIDKFKCNLYKGVNLTNQKYSLFLGWRCSSSPWIGK